MKTLVMLGLLLLTAVCYGSPSLGGGRFAAIARYAGIETDNVTLFQNVLAKETEALTYIPSGFDAETLTVENVEVKAKKTASLIVAGLNLAMAVWGFQQNTTYGIVTGSLFTLRFGGEIYNAVYTYDGK